MTDYFADIASTLRRRFEAMLDDEGKLQVVTFLFFIQNDIRLNQLATEPQLRDLWDHIREEEALVDYVHGCTQQLRFQLGKGEWDSLVVRLADAFTVHYEATIMLKEEDVIAEDLMERMVSNENLSAYMVAYPWLVLILLIDFLDLDQVLGGVRPLR